MDLYGYETGFDMFSIMFFIVFALIVGTIIINAIKGISEWSNNNKQPILDINCKVVSKRISVSHTNSHTDSSGVHHGSSSHTSYYVTFEFESKDRTEFCVNGKEYGMIAEGDYGKLKFQGTRFIEFSKKVPQSEVLFIYYSLSSSSTLILNSLSCSSSATAGAFVIGQTALWFLGNAITSFMLLVPASIIINLSIPNAIPA